MGTGGGGGQTECAESGECEEHERSEFPRDAAGLGLRRNLVRDRFQLDWRFALARDGAQTSMICGTISGRFPSTWLK
jgi:hypothetical protein